MPYIVSELLEGQNLRQRLLAGSIPARESADYALQVAHGLTAAHDHLIVHRDLKPENLFLTTDGRVKILDFGVAKLQAPSNSNPSIESMTTVTKHGSMIGTVAYMSPEQLRGKPVDHRSDIFSFGAILYEMLTGSRAFRGETEVDTMTAVLREEPNPSDLEIGTIPTGYQDIVRHCLEKDPENRFQSAKDLAFALQTFSGSSSLRAASRKTKNIAPPALLWTLVWRAGSGHDGISGHPKFCTHSAASSTDLHHRLTRLKPERGIFGTLRSRWAVDRLQRCMERQTNAAVFHGGQFPSGAAA